MNQQRVFLNTVNNRSYVAPSDVQDVTISIPTYMQGLDHYEGRLIMTTQSLAAVVRLKPNDIGSGYNGAGDGAIAGGSTVTSFTDSTAGFVVGSHAASNLRMQCRFELIRSAGAWNYFGEYYCETVIGDRMFKNAGSMSSTANLTSLVFSCSVAAGIKQGSEIFIYGWQSSGLYT